MAMVVCTQASANQPSSRGLASAMRRDSGRTQGLLVSLSSTDTNFTTTQVSQIGNRVSRPASRVLLKPCRGGVRCVELLGRPEGAGAILPGGAAPRGGGQRLAGRGAS